MKNVATTVGILASALVASPAHATHESGPAAVAERTAEPGELKPSDAIVNIIGEKANSMAPRQKIAFRETFPDKFSQKDAFTNFHTTGPAATRINPQRLQRLQRLKRLQQMQRQNLQRLGSDEEGAAERVAQLDTADVKSAFDHFKPSGS